MMDAGSILLFFQEEHPVLGIALLSALFLIIGSFLNVVIHRLPIMMQHQLEAELEHYKEHNEALTLPLKKRYVFNLAWPPSHCPDCKHPLRVWHNIPILSFLLQKGKCAFCKKNISLQYPMVEGTTLFVSVLGILLFGFTLKTACFLVFSYALLTGSVIDLKHFLLPDEITLSLLWFGLVLSVFSVFSNSHDAILGAAIGYSVFFCIQWLFEYFTGKIGLGQGDYKLIAALAAFTGWQLLPILLLMSSVLGLGAALVLFLCGQSIRNRPIPYGPMLAFSGWIVLAFQPFFLSLLYSL